MLAAKRLDEALYTSAPELPDEPVRCPEPKPKLRPRFYKFVTVGIVGCLFCSGLFLSSLAAGVTTRGYEINSLKNEINNLETANERLRLEIAQMDSLERVEAFALAELGMKKPGAADYFLLPVDEQWAVEGAAGPVLGVAVLEQEEALIEDEIPLFQKKAAAFFSVALKGEPSL